MASNIRFEMLEAAAREVIQKLQKTEKLQGVKIAIIGGLAVCKYLPGYRETSVSLLEPTGCFRIVMLTSNFEKDVDILLAFDPTLYFSRDTLMGSLPSGITKRFKSVLKEDGTGESNSFKASGDVFYYELQTENNTLWIPIDFTSYEIVSITHSGIEDNRNTYTVSICSRCRRAPEEG